MVKVVPQGGKSLGTQRSAASKMLKDEDKKVGGTSLSKSIGWLNQNGGLLDKIVYSEVIEPLSGLGPKKAEQLLGELAEKAWTIKDPTRWLLKAVENGAKGGGGGKGKGSSKGFGKGSWGYGGMASFDPWGSLAGSWMQMPQENSKWVSKAIGLANSSGKLKEPIMWKECIGMLSGLPEGVAVDLVKQLEAKADEVEKPTNWLCSAARKYNGKWKPGNGVLSKKIGELNNSKKLKQPVMWHEVSGALTLMDEAAAELLIAELEEKADEVKNPTNWLAGAARKHFAPPKKE